MPKSRAQKIAEGLIPPSKQTVGEQARETVRMVKSGAKRIVGVGKKYGKYGDVDYKER